MNKILIEEIKRFNLLSKYDSKNTLSENVKNSNSGLLLEVGGAGWFDDFVKLFKNDISLFRSEISNLFKDAEFIKKTGIKTEKEFYDLLKSGKLGDKELLELNRSFMRHGSTTEVKELSADFLAKNPDFAKELSVFNTDDEIKNFLMKGPGQYSKEEAELLLDRLNKSGNRVKPSGGLAPSNTTLLPPVTGGKISKIQRVKNVIKRTKDWVFAKRWRKIALIGGGIGLWLWLTSDDDSPLPTCLASKVSKEEFEKMKNDTPDYLLVKTTGNKEIDSYGGGKFYIDGDFKFGNDSMSGEWEESTGIITITVGKKTYEIPCQEASQGGNNGGGVIPPPPTDEDASITFTDCDTFPFKVGCINNKIKDIQDCLNVDKTGKFNTKTKKALKDKGYGDIITQEIYNTIMTKCGKLDKVESDDKYLMSTGIQTRTDY